KSMDQAKAASAPSGGGGGPVVQGGGSGGASGGGTASRGGGTTQSEGSTSGYHDSMFKQAMYGGLGGSGMDAINSTLGFAIPESAVAGPEAEIGGESSPDGGGGGGGGTGSGTPTVDAFPKAYGDSPQPDTKLNKAFQDALNALSAGDRALVDKVAFT